MLTEWSKEELLSSKKYIWEVSLHFWGHLVELNSLKPFVPLAFREPVGCGVLGEFCDARV
jgi:hypothetical protein